MSIEYAYLLAAGSGVSEIVARNNHEFLVDERGGTGRKPTCHQEIARTPRSSSFLRLIWTARSTSAPWTHSPLRQTQSSRLYSSIWLRPSMEAVSIWIRFPPRLKASHSARTSRKELPPFTLFGSGNDNDFVQTVNDVNGNPIANPNQIFVFGFTDADLDGSVFVPQKFSGFHFGWNVAFPGRVPACPCPGTSPSKVLPDFAA
jgi:hypothetical protein